jgi:hypothetical protein
MAELRKAAGVDVQLVESLVKTHFGPDYTAKLSYDVIKGRYVPSDLPRRLAVPQKLFGVRLWWKTIAEFSDNIGFRLELWRPEYLSQAEALVKDYNAQTQRTKLELSLPSLTAPATTRASAA